MSDYGKLQRPEASAMDAAESAHEGPGAVLEDPAAARGRAGDELKFRASGGRGGVAPMQRLIDERRAMGSALAGRVQRKADGAGAGAGVEIPEGGGAKLPSAVRSRMEPKLGADLSDVQVHTGGGSAKAAAGLGARAFTVGNDVHFNAGEFAPGSKEGDRLLAHELTHVVQGKKSGVQRKPNDNTNAAGGGGANANEHAAGGGGGGSGGHAGASENAAGSSSNANEVSHPDEPAEKEADAVADGVTDQLHGANGAGGGKKGGNKDDRQKGGNHGNAAGHANGTANEAAHGHEHGGSEAKTNANANVGAEKPAPIAAKYVGIGRKVFRSKGDGGKVGAGPDAKPSLKIEAKTDNKADPPAPTAAARDAGAWTAYESNWSGAFLPKLKENGVAETTIAGLVPKKSAWFEDAYNAVETGKDYQAVVDRIFAEIPKEVPGQERHFWSGGAPAQNMADQAIKDKGKMAPPPGGGGGAGAAGAAGPGGAGAGASPQKAMRLETSHVGILFNGVFNQPPSKLDWAKQAVKFWQRASTNYAKATTGTVTAHLNIDFKYAKDQKVNRGAIFGQFEIGEIVKNMKAQAPDGKSTIVNSLILDMWVHGATKDAKGKDKDIDKKVQFTVGASPAVNEEQILNSIDAQIQVAVNS